MVIYKISVVGAYKRVIKQYLTGKQNDYLQSGHLWQVVTYEKWC